MRFTIEVEGETVLDRAFNRIEGAIEDLTPVWDEVKKRFHSIEAENFKSENAKGASGKWKKLSPKYAAIKQKRYGEKGILRRSDRLFDSLTKDTSDSVFKADKTSLSIGSSVPYSRYHQKGEGRLPRRPVIDFSDAQKRELQKAIQKGLLKIIKQNREAGSLLNE